MADKSPTFVPERTEPTQEPARPNLGHIEHMREDTLDEVLAKKKAFNDLIPVLSSLLLTLDKPSMEDKESKDSDPIGASIEAEEDLQRSNLIVSDMKRARNELVRLGDKEEALIKGGQAHKKAA